MPSQETCKREIESLHAFFVNWYTGTAETDNRVERALSPDFEMVTPDGTRKEYDAVIEGIRRNYKAYKPGNFEIEIRNVETRYAQDELRVVRYEEWQETPSEKTGRLSTVLFEAAADAPGGVVWRDLHETWLTD